MTSRIDLDRHVAAEGKLLCSAADAESWKEALEGPSSLSEGGCGDSPVLASLTASLPLVSG